MYGRTDSPCVLQDFVPSGPLPKNERSGCLCVRVGVGVWMGVGRPCPPVRNDIVTPRHLFLNLSAPPPPINTPPFWAAAPKGSMTYAFTHMENFLLLLLRLSSRLGFGPSGWDLDFEAEIWAWRLGGGDEEGGGGENSPV